ncbi:MAG: lipoprotein [Proteobacteria bacterium]|nr:lipoprotein [Pseudomonadota bacterium]
MKKIFLLFWILVILAGCAHPGGWMGQKKANRPIIESTIEEMNKFPQCIILGKVEGDYKLWQAFVPFFWAKQTSDATKDGAILKAAEMGGTHIVWREKGQFEYKMAIAEGTVYKCK